jgi:hypothetical protein
MVSKTPSDTNKKGLKEVDTLLKKRQKRPSYRTPEERIDVDSKQEG